MSFPKYDDTKDSGIDWLGQVPKNWIVSRLGFESWVRARLGWKGLKADEYVDEGFAFLSTPNIKNNEIDFENVNFITQERFDESPEIKLSLGDVLLAKDGSTLGNVNVVRSLPRPSTVNSSIAVITPKESVNCVFLYYLFRSSYMEQTIQEIKGGMGVPHLFQSDLVKFYIPRPSIEEQTAIANFLDAETSKIDALVAEQRRLIELLKEKRQAVISHAVTKGLNPNAPMKDSGIEWLGDVPEQWDVSRLGYESWVRARLGWKGLKASEYVDDGFAFLSTPNIKGNKEIDFENVNFISQERFDESPEIKLRVGDVLLAKDGSTLGIVNYVKELPRPTTVNSSIAVISPNDRLKGSYLFYLFRTTYMEHTIQRIKGGMGVPHLFQSDLNKFYLPIPPTDDQDKIIEFLTAKIGHIDSLEAEAEKTIELLQERRTALISAAVTGKIDVREYAAQETA